MASPQLEDGYTRVANEILENIMKVSLNGTQFRIVMAVWRYTYGFQRTKHEMSISFLSQSINASRGQVDRELSTLISRNILKVVKTGERGARVIMFNKNHTQWCDCTLNSGLSSNPRTVPSSTSSTEVSSNPRTKKESIKEKNKENIYVEIINYLNKKAHKRFSPKSAANRKLINGRIAEGRTLEDFKHVIDVKCEEWLNDPSMNEYLRPATLFRPTNFENYVNQPLKQQKSQRQSDHRDKEIEFQKWMAEGKNPNDFDWN